MKNEGNSEKKNMNIDMYMIRHYKKRSSRILNSPFDLLL